MNLYARGLGWFGRTKPGYWYARHIPPRIDPHLLRLTGGRFSSLYPLMNVMLLTTTGAKTGKQRTLPLTYLIDGDSLVLVASNYGKSSHPAWYRNLLANPEAQVLAGKYSGRYVAADITDPTERERAWDLAVTTYAGYADYEGRAANRTIPLVRLTRATST